MNSPQLFGIPAEFILFGLTLVGVALFHRHTLYVALAGLAAIVIYKYAFTGFGGVAGVSGLGGHLHHEWIILGNLLGLLTGFALLARHFEDSRVPDIMPDYLPDDWKGGAVLLGMVFIVSSFLDNIAAALIGGTTARHVFRSRLHIGYLAAIVAAANAGGAWSVIGDTTTTMMWLAGVSPLVVIEAIVAASVSFAVFSIFAARQQQAYSPIVKDAPSGLQPEWARLMAVAIILLVVIGANVLTNMVAPELANHIPVLGLAVWFAILLTALLAKPDWRVVPGALKGSLFLLSLVFCASLMPVEHLPAASWNTTLGLGFVSAVFDNIPLTALALRQGGYDWGYLAFAVGFGGSMLWFGSSAGVALANLYPEAKSTISWLRYSWYVPLAYVIGFMVMLAIIGWHPDAAHN